MAAGDATFAAGGTTATFVVDTRSFKNAGPWPRQLAVTVVINDPAELDNLFALQSWNVKIDRAIGGIQTWVNVGSGLGEGDLIVESLGSWTAVLTDVSAEPPIGASSNRFVGLSFLQTGTL